MKDKLYFPLLSARDLQLPFYVTTIGAHAHQDVISRPQGMDQHQLLFTKKGSGTVELNGRKIPVSAGTALYHAPHTPHFYYANTADWETHWITFAGSGVDALLNLESGVYAGDIAPLFSLHHRIITAPHDIGWNEQVTVLLYQMLLQFKNMADSDNADILTMRLKPSVDYMHRHFAETIELKELASITGVTPTHYCHLFKSVYQVTPFTLLLRLRLQAAKNMLIAYPNRSIEKISALVGFNNPSYFIQTFKKHEGITPTAFRSAHIGTPRQG